MDNKPRIAFICGSASPGKDGVGDYCRLIAEGLEAQGVQTKIFAVRDKSIPSSTSPVENGNVIQFPIQSENEAIDQTIKRSIEEFTPDWLSYQFVPYSYNPKGIINNELQFLKSLKAPKSRAHFMMHELWLGLSQGESIKRKVVGWLQRRSILKLLKAASPSIIHTSNQSYASVLEASGFKAELLPIPSNIPVAPAKDPSKWAPEGSKLTEVSDSLKGILFGTIHPQWDPNQAVDWLKTKADTIGRPLSLITVGRNGDSLKLLRQAVSSSEGVTLHELGEQPPELISQALHFADFGLSSMPIGLLEKSGTHSAMRSHNLPVYATRNDWKLARRSPPDTPKGVYFIPANPEAPRFKEKRREEKQKDSTRRDLAQKLLLDLEASIS